MAESDTGLNSKKYLTGLTFYRQIHYYRSIMPAQKEILVVNDGNYKDFLPHPYVVLMMGIKGGGACERTKSYLTEIARVYTEVNFGIAWVNHWNEIQDFEDDHPDLFDAYDRPPTTLFIKELVIKGWLSGFYPKDDISKRVALLLDV